MLVTTRYLGAEIGRIQVSGQPEQKMVWETPSLVGGKEELSVVACACHPSDSKK
jgi:hypothetical protein